jgi:putative chitinase
LFYTLFEIKTMLTVDHLAFFAPRAHPDYVAAITDSDWGVGMMNRYGILANQGRLAGFLSNGFHETGGLTVLAENMKYSAARMRVVWPKRFRAKSDAELAHLVNNERALASEVYNGRMGNRPGTEDGYYFRGRGFLQVTGRDAYMRYADILGGLDLVNQPDLVESQHVMFALSCVEWAKEGMNELCDGGRFDEACAKLNTGSAKNIAGCVGIEDRRRWHGKVTAWLTQNPAAMTEEPMALIYGMDPDGDTVPGQEEHWSEHDEMALA